MKQEPVPVVLYRYNEFKALGPAVTRWWTNPDAEYQYYVRIPSNYDQETAKACYDFVIETVLQLQGKNVFLY